MALASKETLKDGKVLNHLIQMYLENSTPEKLYSLLLCLVDSDLQVPMNLNISDEDAEAFKKSKKNDVVSLKNELRFKPDWLEFTETKKLYFPIFSTIEEAGKDYSENFSWINLDIETCINFVEGNDKCSGLVLNAFSTPIVIQDRVYEVLKEIVEKELD